MHMSRSSVVSDNVDTRLTIGRLTLAELVVMLLLAASTAFGVWMALALLPIMKEIPSPGSGGGAQMLVAIVFGPAFLTFAVMAIASPIVFILVYRHAAARIRQKQLALAKFQDSLPPSAN